jgi:hypothetical protein
MLQAMRKFFFLGLSKRKKRHEIGVPASDLAVPGSELFVDGARTNVSASQSKAGMNKGWSAVAFTHDDSRTCLSSKIF